MPVVPPPRVRTMHGAVQHLIVIMDFDANLIPIDRASRMNASAILFFRSSAETFGLSSFLFDDKGKQYVDFMMGWCVGNFGWGNAVLLEAAVQFEGPDYVYPGYSNATWIELASLLVSISPGSLKKRFRATGVSEAVDLALQAAMLHIGRLKFVSVEGSYHSNTIGGLSVGSSEHREDCKNLLPRCHKIKPPLNAKSLARVEALLKGRDVAAFIMEPININLGVLI